MSASILSVGHEVMTEVRETGVIRKRKTEVEVDVWDWVIDGQSLRRRFGACTLMDVSVALSPAEVGMRDWLLRSLLGDANPRDPRYGMSDGRVVLLHCYCGDPNCATVTADLIVSSGTVEWHDIGWQVAYEPFEGGDTRYSDAPLFSIRFERDQYERTLRGLLQG